MDLNLFVFLLFIQSEAETQRFGNVGHKQRWAVACSSFTFILTVIVVLMHSSARLHVLIVGTKLEGLIIICLLTFWTAIVAVVSDAENGLAVNEEGVVVFGNLYYFSWGGLVCSVLLFVSYIQSIYFIDVVSEYRSRSPRLMVWSAFMTTSIIVMGSSASIFDINCNVKNPEQKFCNRTKLAVSLGIIGALASILMVGMKLATQQAPFWLEFSLSGILFVIYAFGVAYVTSEKGPGAPLGNLYYSIWASFIESFFLCVGCFETYQEILAADLRTQSAYEEKLRKEMEQETEALSKGFNDTDFFTNYDDEEYGDEYTMRSEAFVDDLSRSQRTKSSRVQAIPLDDEESVHSSYSRYSRQSRPVENGRQQMDEYSQRGYGRSARSFATENDETSWAQNDERSQYTDSRRQRENDEEQSVNSGYAHSEFRAERPNYMSDQYSRSEHDDQSSGPEYK